MAGKKGKYMKSLMKKTVRWIMLAAMVVILPITVSCTNSDNEKDDGKLSIVTTLFPQYDFARQIAGDKAQVTLLLKPGTEAHDYDPTPSDMIAINNGDLFIYTGKYMEPWAENILESIDNKELNILDASKNITLCKSEEDDHNHDQQETDHYEYDPHIWTSPKNAVIMVNNILEELILIDPDNEGYYRSNAEKYISEIEKIDSDIRNVVENAEYDTIYFGGRFALLYFVREYGLNYVSAFDSCSSETEPSAKLVAQIIDEMKANGAGTVYYEELSEPKTAQAIADEIGGDILLLHSCHNVSSEDFKNGATYVSIMKQNVENLKKGLN